MAHANRKPSMFPRTAQGQVDKLIAKNKEMLEGVKRREPSKFGAGR